MHNSKSHKITTNFNIRLKNRAVDMVNRIVSALKGVEQVLVQIFPHSDDNKSQSLILNPIPVSSSHRKRSIHNGQMNEMNSQLGSYFSTMQIRNDEKWTSNSSLLKKSVDFSERRTK